MTHQIVPALVIVLASYGTAYASHELVEQPHIDVHILWEDFKHELLAYPRVNASMDQDGVIRLNGQTVSGYEKASIREFAVTVNQATKVINNILSK